MPVRFQVDPDFYDHPKSIGMSDAATALWVRAGSYSAAKLTDGFIAEHVLSTLSRSTPEEAADELTRRGLWRRVKGGYRFHQWDQRNLTRKRVEGERAGDRTRKAEARAAARRAATQSRNAQGQTENPQVNTTNVRPDSGRTPPGNQPESGGNPPVSVLVSVSELVSGSGRPPDVRAGPPPPACPEHLDDPHPPPCGPCADTRRARQRHDHDQAARAADAQQAQARERATARQLAIDACRLCDTTGERDGHLCPHDPDLPDRARRGGAAVRAALGVQAVP